MHLASSNLVKDYEEKWEDVDLYDSFIYIFLFLLDTMALNIV